MRGGHTETQAEHHDVVVVGSGFGGSVSAFRSAQAGKQVLVLERGRAYPPGSFARSPAEFSRAFWDPSEGLHGLFDVWSFRGLDAVVSSGLGGGSLVYANVMLRKDERWFVHHSPIPGGGYEHWPLSRADLDPHYDRVEQMLGVQPFPATATGYDRTPKTAAMRELADRLGMDWQLPPLAVSFASRPGETPMVGAQVDEPEYGNLHGLPRTTCRLCGECDIGCNDGAKNSLDHTYLSAAQHHGAEIRTRSEVRSISPRPAGGYEVSYVEHEESREGSRTHTRRLAPHVVTCDRLVLAAGTLGTTYLLLRNRAAFPAMSGALGSRFSGNGDLLTFVLNAGNGATDASARLDGSRGPVITSTLRAPDATDGGTGRGFYVQDAGYPGVVDWMLEASQVHRVASRAARFAWARARAKLRRSPKAGVSAALSALLGRGELSSTSLPLLGMGRDTPDGWLFLRRGQLQSSWTLSTSQEYFDRVRTTMREMADALDGDFGDNPLWWGKHVVTAHPLGGCPVGTHPGDGVCDSYGEVFGYPGLYVADGAAMPGPVGPNPSLTIAAMADRACDRMLEGPPPRRHTRPAARATAQTAAPAADPVAAPAAAGATSLSFTEEMTGFVALGQDDPERGAQTGRARGDKLTFRLTITAEDVEAFVADPEHEARADGYVECDLLGGRHAVTHGMFTLFATDGGPRRRVMRYRLAFADGAGHPVTLVGVKEIADDPGVDLWRDTTRLPVRLLAGHVRAGSDPADSDTPADADVLGAGVVTIDVADLAGMLGTFRTQGPDGTAALTSFWRLFLGELYDVYRGSSEPADTADQAQHSDVEAGTP